MTAITHYCPSCDTPLEVREYGPEEDCGLGEPGHDAYLECPRCNWEASAIEQDSFCAAWAHVTGCHSRGITLINEPREK